LAFDLADAAHMVVRVADSSMSELECAEWFRTRLR
jgi:hypothetical protein